MIKKIISMLLSLALLLSCVAITPVLASAATPYYLNVDFEDVSDLAGLEAKSGINKVHAGSNGTVGIADMPERGNVTEFNFSAAPSDGNDRTNYIQFYREGMSFVNNKVVMEAKIYPTATGNHAIRLFEHTWSSGGSGWDPLVIFQNGKIVDYTNNELSTYSANQWYHVFVVVNSTTNPAERTYDVYVNGSLIGSSLKSNGTFITSESISFINVAHRAWAAGKVYIDDVKIYEYPGLALENSSISENLQDLDPLTNEISIKFSSILNEGTLAGIALKDSDGQSVSITPGLDSVDKSLLVLTLGEDMEPEAVYTLSFEGMADVLGGSFDDTISFTTGSLIIDVSYHFNEDFEDVSGLNDLEAKAVINKIHAASNGAVDIVNMAERGNVTEFDFSAAPSDGNDRTNYIQFYSQPGISFVSNKVVMEAKVYPTATGNHAIRLFEHTWSSGGSGWDPLVIFQNGKIVDYTNNELSTYSANQWYHVFVVVNSTTNPAERTYDVYVNGSLIGSSLKSNGTFITSESISFINVAHRAWAAGKVYIDDVKIYEYPGLALENSNIAENLQEVNPQTKKINLKFASLLNDDTLKDIKLKASDGYEVNITPGLDSLDKSILTITLNETLEGVENYTLSFEGMTDIFGKSYVNDISFTTGVLMMNMTSVPADGAKDVGVGADIILSFDSPIDPATFDKSKITISGVAQEDYSAELTAENVITITFNSKLSDATLYTVTLDDTILSTEATGSKELLNKSFNFTTEVSDKFVDEFDNYVYRMYDYSKKEDDAPNFSFFADSENYADDNVIELAYNEAPAYMIYYIEEGIRSFRLDKRVGNSQRPDKDGPVKIYVASEYDKETGIGNWQDVTPAEELIEVPGLATFLTAYKHELTTGMPEGARYLKIEINAPAEQTENVWSPLLTKLEINHVLPVLKLVTVSPQVIDAGDWIKIDFTSAVKDTCLADAITVTDKDGIVLDIRDALLSDFSKRVKLEIAGGLDEYSEYTVTIDPEKLVGATGVAFTGNNVIVYKTGDKPYQLRAEFFSGTDTTQSALTNMTSGTITVKGTVLSKEIDAQIIIARYNKDNEMVDIRTPDTFAKGDTVHPFSEAFTGCAATDTIKVFCLNGLDNVKPLGECKVLEPAQ